MNRRSLIKAVIGVVAGMFGLKVAKAVEPVLWEGAPFEPTCDTCGKPTAIHRCEMIEAEPCYGTDRGMWRQFKAGRIYYRCDECESLHQLKHGKYNRTALAVKYGMTVEQLGLMSVGDWRCMVQD